MKTPRMFRRRTLRGSEIAPDEIFLDTREASDESVGVYDRLEKPLPAKTFWLISIFFLAVTVGFIIRLADIQVAEGNVYRGLALENRKETSTIFAARGTVTDRHGQPLIWNERGGQGSFARRAYIDTPGFGHLLGYVSYPQADAQGIFYRTEYSGKDGVEKAYGARLSGYNGTKNIEINALQEVIGKSSVEQPVAGQDLQLSIDARVQGELYTRIKKLAEEVNFRGGAGAIMDVDSGELLAMTSFPEYDSSAMTSGQAEKISQYNTNSQNPFLSRAGSGLYTPGSIVKPFMALGALEEGVITPQTTIVSDGSISVPNPYNPGNPTVFYDWKAHGPLELKEAIAQSSNVYFYEIGGGFQDQPGLGIKTINEYMHQFGFGEPTGFAFDEATGIVPDPEWKRKNFPRDPTWRIGDTYNTSIGQYGFQVTSLQMARATAAIANGGQLLKPKVLSAGTSNEAESIDISDQHFETVREGMRLGVLEGTASGLNTDAVKIAAKTGTAELDAAKERTNSWVIGFFPYEDPEYAFSVVMESGPYGNHLGGVYVMRQLVDWMGRETPEYLR